MNKIDFSAFFYLQPPANCWTFESTNFQSAPKMTMHMKRLLTILWVFFLANLLHAQDGFWQELNSPYGGKVKTIFPTNTTKLYANFQTSNKFFRSDDYGYNWQRIQINEPDSAYVQKTELVVDFSGKFYQILSFMSGNGLIRKLFSSTDDGQSWELQVDSCPIVQIFPLPSGVLLGKGEGTLDGCDLMRSTDNGETWEVVYHDSSTTFIQNSIKIQTANSGRVLIFLVNSKNILITEDDGATWATGSLPKAAYLPPFISTYGTVLNLQTSLGNFGVFRSEDGGINWTMADIMIEAGDNPSDIIQLNSGNLLLATDRHLYSSDNDGISWHKLDDTHTQAFEFPILQQLPNGDLLGTGRQALIRSSDEGLTWSCSSFGLTHGLPYDFTAIDQQNLLALTHFGFWSTTNGGDTWELLLADTSNTLLYTPHLDHNRIIVISPDSFAVIMGNGIWATSDGGQTFNNIAPPGGLIKGELNLSSDGWVICTGQEGVQIAPKFNDNWTLSLPNHISTNFAEHIPSGKWFMLAYPDSTPNYRALLFVSSDHGQTWTNIDTFTQLGQFFHDLHADSDHRLYLTESPSPTTHMAISEDGGENWSYQIIPSRYHTGEIYTNNLGHYFAPIYLHGTILTSVDQGQSWYTLPQKGQSFIHPFMDSEGYLYGMNEYHDLLKTSKSTETGVNIHTYVQRDADLDCSTPDAQEPLKNWNITVSGEEDYYGTTNANGYCTFYLDTAVYTVTARTPQVLWWSLCDSVQTVNAAQSMGSDTVHFVALPLAECPLMSVNVAAPMLRRCFNNTVYISYCNQGTEPADSAWVDVMLDEYLSFISSAQPHESLGNNIYRFYVGDVNSGDCGDFNLT
ncbi:MAG TPA: hypothetical protein VK168_22320, partial [Saprospiraceae bacterium]|nr:hypothetical protein [Saprospiraceae bacterium]